MDNGVSVGIQFPLDESARKKALEALEGIRKAQATNAKEALAGAKSYDEITKANAKLESQYRNMVKVLKSVDATFRTQEEQLKDNKTAALDAAKAMDTLAQAEQRAAQEAEQLRAASLDKAGQAAGSIGQVGGGISQLTGNSAIGQVAGGGTALFDVLENVPKLKDALKGLPDILQATTQASGLGGLAGSLKDAIPQLGATGASVVALGSVAAAVAIPLALFAAGMAITEANTKKAVAAQEALNASLLAGASARGEAADFVESGDVQGLVQAREAEQESLFDITRQREVLIQDIARQNAIIEEESVKWNASFTVPALRAARKTTEDELAALNSSYEQAATRLGEFDETLATISPNAVAAAQNFEELNQIEQELAQTTQEYNATLQSQGQILNQISQLEHQGNVLRQNYSEQNLDRLEDEALAATQALETENLEAQFANEDRLANQKQFQDSLVAIEKEGQAKIESLRGDLAALPAERFKAITDAESKGNADIDKARKSFMADSIKTVQKFQESERRIQQRGQIERLRLLQDLNDSLSDAQRDNNVIAFLEAQRNGEKQLSQNAQDAGIEAKQRADDFAAENAERRNALNERIADIQANLDKEREQINTQFAERAAAINKSIADETKAIDDRTKAAIAANNAQAANEAQNAIRALQREALQAQQQEQRDAVVESRRQREHQEQLTRIDQQAAAQRAALSSVMAQISALQAKAAQSTSSSNNLKTSSGSASTFSFSTAGYNSPKPFAEGGIVDKKTVGLLGEREGYGDMIVPFRKSDGLPISPSGRSPMGKGSNNITYAPNFNVTVGDIASKAEVSEALREYAMAQGQAEISKMERLLNPA